MGKKNHHYPQLSTTTKKKQNETKLMQIVLFQRMTKMFLKIPFPKLTNTQSNKNTLFKHNDDCNNKAQPKPFDGILLLKCPSHIYNWTNFKIKFCNKISILFNIIWNCQ